jgi:hypothetical protein
MKTPRFGRLETCAAWASHPEGCYVVVLSDGTFIDRFEIARAYNGTKFRIAVDAWGKHLATIREKGGA